jgi:predicted nucleic acid-binding protein
MLYIDTCVLLAVLTPEVHSGAAEAFLEQARAPLAISSWSVTELHSALGLKVRSRALSQAQAEAVLQGFESGLAPGLQMLEPEPQDYRNANACLRGWATNLRAADALHLAIASGRGATLCSLDGPFVAAAQRLGLAAQLLALNATDPSEAGAP